MKNQKRFLLLFFLVFIHCDSQNQPSRTQAPPTSKPASVPTQAPTAAPTPEADLKGPIDMTVPKAPPTTKAPTTTTKTPQPTPSTTSQKIKCKMTSGTIVTTYFGNSGIGSTSLKMTTCKVLGEGCDYVQDSGSIKNTGKIECKCSKTVYFETTQGSCSCANALASIPAGAICSRVY